LRVEATQGSRTPRRTSLRSRSGSVRPQDCE